MREIISIKEIEDIVQQAKEKGLPREEMKILFGYRDSVFFAHSNQWAYQNCSMAETIKLRIQEGYNKFSTARDGAVILSKDKDKYMTYLEKKIRNYVTALEML